MAANAMEQVRQRIAQLNNRTPGQAPAAGQVGQAGTGRPVTQRAPQAVKTAKGVVEG